MYKVLIADDEPLVLVGVQSMLRWEEYDTEICATAHNGDQALTLIGSHRPDIVITDIKMPLKTGLQVAEACHALYGNLPVFIMLTSYEEFAFVRAAMHLGVVEYLVKLELTRESLASAVQRAVTRVEEIRGTESTPAKSGEQGSLQAFREKFFVRLYNNLFESPEQLSLQRADLKLEFSAACYVVGACEVCGIPDALSTEKLLTLFNSTLQMVRDTVEKYLPCYVTGLDLRRFNILFCLPEAWPDAGERVADILQKASTIVYNYFNVQLLCGIGHTVEEPLQVCESFRAARAVRSLATPGTAALASAMQEQDAVFNLAQYKQSLTRAFEEFDTEALHACMTQITDSIVEGAHSYVQAMDAAGSLLYMATSLLLDGETLVGQVFADNPDGYRCLYKLVNAQQCCEWMLRLRDGLCELLQTRRQSYKERVVSNVKEYIRANLDRRLTLNDVAASFGFSPNYLSQLFAKYGECGFVDYITTEKISAAKAMLKDGSLKIYEIAERLGYESAFYFSKVFKKITGQSPREYMQGTGN